MDDMNAFERQVIGQIQRFAGPQRPVDDAALFAALSTAPRSPQWRMRMQSMFSATKLVVAGAIVALFAGFLVTGVLPPSKHAAPGAVGTAEASAAASPRPTASPDAIDPRYEATASLKVDPGPDAGPDDMRAAEDALLRYAAMVRTLGLAEAIIAQLGLDESAERLLERTSVETSEETLVLSLRVSGDDVKTAIRVVRALGNEARQRVDDEVITSEMRAADRAIVQIRRSIRELEARLRDLQVKQGVTTQEREEIVSLEGQIASLQADASQLGPSSSTFVRNRLKWLDRPRVSGQEESGERPPVAIPTREVIVAARMIEQGTTIGPDMLNVVTVPMDATNAMALTDAEAAIGRIAAIDILEDQAITPNMFADG